MFLEIGRDFQPLNINVLLYGNDTFDNTLNSSLLRAVHDYIKSTKRLTTHDYIYLFD